MPGPLKALRSALSLAAVLVWLLGGGSILLYGFFLPATWIRPSRRRALISSYMKIMATGIFALFETGGARFQRVGRVPTGEPVLILMNHQSILDILSITLLADPYVPAFVPRRRYARWYVPLVAPSIWLLECPVVDPERKPKAALATLRKAALDQRHGLLLFPEGHRSVDGEVGPFHTAGTQMVLRTRRLPVWVVVSDGFWSGRRLVDFILNVDKVQGRTEVVGCFTPPDAEEEIPGFVAKMREVIVERLREMRARSHAGI
jgi:1-acyl-sn-glycerol-3-phosphate acyltransferase